MKSMKRKMAALLALALSVSSLPYSPVSAEEAQIALRLDRVELSPESVATLGSYGGYEERIQRMQAEIDAIQQELATNQFTEEERQKKENDILQKQASIASWDAERQKPENQRVIPVNLQISGNTNGFIASEFGITYDSRLTLRDIQKDVVGDAFQYVCNENENLIWFSGASSFGSEVASRDNATVMTLYFQLPEDYKTNDQFVINFAWEGHGKQAFWYSDRNQNDIAALKGNSHNGQIWLPSADSARLSHQEVQMNQGDTFQLGVENVSGNCYWFSGNTEVASISQEGVVTALKPGVATIYCVSTATGQTLTCEVTVTTYYYYVMKENDFDPVPITTTAQIVYLEYPNPPAEVTWFTSNPSVATVEKGRVRGLSDGIAMITALCNGVAYMKSVEVNLSGTSTTQPTETLPVDEPPVDPQPIETVPTEPETPPIVTEEPETPPIETDPPATETEYIEPTISPHAPVEGYYGDIDGDTTVSIADVLNLNQALLGLTSIDDSKKAAADIYQDGSINDKDSLTLLKYLVDIVTYIPVIPQN